MNKAAPADRSNSRQAAIAEVRALIGDRLSTSASMREQHGHGESYHKSAPPDAVAFAGSTEEVSRIVGICAAHQVPVVPFGTGTSLEGHVNALEGGICIDLTRMNEVVEVNAEDLDVRVQPGVTRKQLNDHLRDTGLFFPIDPGADASLGGMAATRASGTNAVRYGTMRHNVLGLTVVLADGRVIKTGSRARKSAAGYDLTAMFVGSEGTLGVITEMTLRLYGIPEAISSAVCAFPRVEDAVNAVILIIQSGIPVARIEFLDEAQMDACIRYSKLQGYRIAPTLFLEFHGSTSGVAEQAEQAMEIAAEYGGSDVRWTTKPEERSKLWQARHDVAYASAALRPGTGLWATDVCVPISRLADCITATRADIDSSGLIAPMVGHVGDGNFHLTILVDRDDPAEMRRADQLNDRLVARALEMGGTCTGEHGVGYGKMDKLVAEHGVDAMDVMASLKRALDPDNILNPGKVVRV